MKRFKSLLATAMSAIMALAVVSCQSDEGVTHVSDITISNPSPLQLKVGDTDVLRVSILPDNAEDLTFEVFVSDPSVIEVAEDYVITALAEGESTITVKSVDGGKEASVNVIVSPADIRTVSVAEFMQAEVHPHIWYELTGVITEVVDEEYGNFYLQDGEDIVYVYGLTAEKAESNDNSFASLGLKAQDVLTLIGTRDYYAEAQAENQKIRVGGPAYYKSHIEFIPDLTFEFAVTDEPDADNLYYATITPSELDRQYVVMDVNEYALHAFVNSGANIEDWMMAYIQSTIDKINAEAGGVLNTEELVTLFLAERGRTGVYEDYVLEPTLGENYLMAFTIDKEAVISDLSHCMYTEIVADGDVEVALSLIAAKAKDLVITMDFPNNWIKDPYYPQDNHPVLICWGKKQDIGHLSDEELVARDYEVLKAKAAEAEVSEVVLLKESYQIYWRDYTDADPLILSGVESLYAEDGFEPNTDYMVYAYAMQPDYVNGGFFAATNIARLEATTLDLNLVNINFAFDIDRIVPDNNGDLMTYFSVEADDAYQRFTFCPFNAADLSSYAQNGVTPKIEDVAAKILQRHIDEYHSTSYTQPLENWTYLGLGLSRTGVKINADASKNKWYILAGALDGDLKIASDVKCELFDLAGMGSTEAAMNLTVTGAEGAYTYSVNPDTTPYIVKTITVKEMESWLVANNSANKEVATYVNDFVKSALKTSSVADFLKNNGKTAPVTNQTLNVTEDTYVIAYTLYAKSGAVNGLSYELLKAPVVDATVITFTDADNVAVFNNGKWGAYIFNLTWNGGYICFQNGDGVYDTSTYEYTHTKHIILNQEYSSSDTKYNVDLTYTYKGDPNYMFDDNNIFAEEATVITTDNGDGTYTITADIFYKDETHIKYIYTGAIPDELITGPAQ